MRNSSFLKNEYHELVIMEVTIMIHTKTKQNMGHADHGWLKSIHHFSFANYIDYNNIQFGALRVVNDDLVASGEGFSTHPHQNMEILSYVIDGELTHKDSMGNVSTIGRGHAQYMSAGTGVYHSEYNEGEQTLRFLQIWIMPDREGHTPNYGDYRFDWNARTNGWLHMVSSRSGSAPIQMNQDVNFYVTEIEAGMTRSFSVAENRQAYVVQIEGESIVNGAVLENRDALEIIGEQEVFFEAEGKQSHVIVIEIAKADSV